MLRPPPALTTSLRVTSLEAGDLEWWLAKYAPKVFGGVGFSTDASSVMVYSPQGGNALDELARQLALLREWEKSAVLSESGLAADVSPTFPVVMEHRPRSWFALSRLAARSMGFDLDGVAEQSTIEWRKGAKGRIRFARPNYIRNTLEIGITEPNDVDRKELGREFAGAVELLEADVPTKTSRLDDLASHWGGANITGDGSPYSSTAFTAASSGGTRKMLTAGHCGPAGNSFRSPIYYNSSSQWGWMSVSYGGGAACNGCHDVGFLTGSSYNPYIYIGTKPYYNAAWSRYQDWDNSGSVAGVRGSSVPGPLVNLSASGSRTGQTGGYQVQPNNPLHCAMFSGDPAPTCGLRYGIRAGGAAIRPGDSGGAVFVYESGLLKAVGIIVGNSTCNIYYTPISIALADFGLSLVTL